MKSYTQVLKELEALEAVQAEMEEKFQEKLENSSFYFQGGVHMTDIGVLVSFLREEASWIQELMGWQDREEK